MGSGECEAAYPQTKRRNHVIVSVDAGSAGRTQVLLVKHSASCKRRPPRLTPDNGHLWKPRSWQVAAERGSFVRGTGNGTRTSALPNSTRRSTGGPGQDSEVRAQSNGPRSTGGAAAAQATEVPARGCRTEKRLGKATGPCARLRWPRPGPADR